MRGGIIRSAESGPDFTPNDRQIMRVQAATLANLGRDAEARELYQRYAALTGGRVATCSIWSLSQYLSQ
jgi:hypothetical protein